MYINPHVLHLHIWKCFPTCIVTKLWFRGLPLYDKYESTGLYIGLHLYDKYESTGVYIYHLSILSEHMYLVLVSSSCVPYVSVAHLPTSFQPGQIV